MGAKNLYTVKSVAGTNTVFSVTKFDLDLNVEEVYHVSELGPDGANMICNCFAGARHNGCRHRTMLRLFQAEGKVDTGWFYQFDKKKWIEPIATPAITDVDISNVLDNKD